MPRTRFSGFRSTAPRLSPGAAALRIFFGIPSAFVLGVLSFVGVFVFCWAAVAILFSESIPRSAWAHLVGLQRFGYRLLAYQAGLVDEYLLPTLRASLAGC